MSEDPTAAKIVFFGTDAFSVPSLIKLIATGWNVCAVVTKPDSRTGRGRALTEPAVKRLAQSKDIPVFQPKNLMSIEPELAEIGAKIAVIVAYGKIIPVGILNLFPKGLINVHPSLLPRYRGATPIETAILAGDDETGVTLMRLDAGLDTGPTYDTEKIQLAGTENREELYARLSELGAELLVSDLAAIIEGRVVAIPQNESEAVEVGRITKTDGQIDWTKPADAIERQVRAYLGWPGSYTTIGDSNLTITASHVDASLSGPKHPGKPFKTADGQLAFSTGDQVLVADQVRPAGKREMPSRDYLTGHTL